MVFNSVAFLFFLIAIFCLHWFIFYQNKSRQNAILLVFSLLFYSFWDYRFLFPLSFTIVLDFYVGKYMYQYKENLAKKKILLFISVLVNLCLLGFFKYFDFFIHNLNGLFSIFDSKVSLPILKVILPVGISFYTFHGLSYVLDIFHGRIQPEKNIVNYGLFVSFFPLLVAGPIERATHLLPQFHHNRKLHCNQAIIGLRQILWGLTKKIVIADNCAEYVNLIFNDYHTYNGSTLLVGAILFSFQIYGDFSGYTDIALGVAKLFGIELLKNFSFPYFSRNIVEFWHRWHISLSSWFRDYLYIPLGGGKGSEFLKYRNIFIVFLVSGFWHGANFTFLFWGFLNAVLYLFTSFFVKKIDYSITPTFSIKNGIFIIFTFFLVTICWIFFRSENLSQGFAILQSIFSNSFLELPTVFPKTIFVLLFLFILVEWKGKDSNFAIENLDLLHNKILRYLFYYILVFLILYYFGKKFPFIYFQF